VATCISSETFHMDMATTPARIPCVLERTRLLANGRRRVQATCQLWEIEWRCIEHGVRLVKWLGLDVFRPLFALAIA
jgi:hypothetical protein